LGQQSVIRKEKLALTRLLSSVSLALTLRGYTTHKDKTLNQMRHHLSDNLFGLTHFSTLSLSRHKHNFFFPKTIR
jgi:hypothetical protein